MKLFITRIVLKLVHFRQWLIAQVMFGFLNFLKLFPADGAINFIDWLMRKIGPRTKRHRLMIANLRNAFPDKSDAEIDDIALGSWANMGRLAAEYVFLDRLFDFDPMRNEPGRVEVSGIPIFMDLLTNPRPFIVFTGHTGISSLLPVAGAAFGLYVSVLFRPPNNPYVHKSLRLPKRSHGQARAIACGLFLCARAGSWKPATAWVFWSIRSSARG